MHLSREKESYYYSRQTWLLHGMMALSFQNFSKQLKNNSAIYGLEYMKVIYL